MPNLDLALRGLACVGLLGLVACADVTPDGQDGLRLDELVVTDPDFDFATSRSIRLDLRAADGAAPQAVEVTDVEGRRLMDGAFVGSASVELKVPVGRAGALKVRVGQGGDAVEREISVGADGRAVSEL